MAANTSVGGNGPYAGRYLFEEELGRGGMGRVVRARDLKIGRSVALKLLGPGARDEQKRRRFEQEARAAGALNHANILAVYDVGEQDGEPYIVSELLEGETLRSVLRDGPLAPDEVLDLGTQLANGLAAAHRKGIVHGDLKPENVFLTDEGWVKILDFGIAKLRPELAEQRRDGPAPLSTDTGNMVGRPACMAPEQVRGETADLRSDVFAFGAVLHEMLSGRSVFDRATPDETRYAILHEAPTLADSLLARVVDRCLEKDAALRYANAGELLDDLATIARGVRTAANKAQRRRVTIIAAAMLLTAIGLATVARKLLRPSRSIIVQDVVAVFPFSMRGTGQSAFLSEGMVDLLSTTLTSSSLRTVDPNALLDHLRREGWAPDPDRVRGIAARFGARHYVLGTVVEVGTRLRIHASVYNADSGVHPTREAHADGESARIFDLVDELSTQIRSAAATAASGQGRQPPDRLVRLAEITTSSPAALTAYLEGTHARRSMRLDDAVAAFRRAITADPGFALAYYSLAYAAWAKEGGSSKLVEEPLQHALELREKLPEQDRQRLDAFNAYLTSRFADAERALRDIVRAHPDDLEASLLLGRVRASSNTERGERPARENPGARSR